MRLFHNITFLTVRAFKVLRYPCQYLQAIDLHRIYRPLQTIYPSRRTVIYTDMTINNNLTLVRRHIRPHVLNQAHDYYIDNYDNLSHKRLTDMRLVAFTQCGKTLS